MKLKRLFFASLFTFGLFTCNVQALNHESVSTINLEDHVPSEYEKLILHGLCVYPNPSRGIFRVQLPSLVPGKCSVSITNLNGHSVLYTETAAAENISIDISALPKGIYLLQVVGLDSEYNNLQKIVLL